MEIASTIAGEEHPSREQLQKMTFLRNIIRESNSDEHPTCEMI